MLTFITFTFTYIYYYIYYYCNIYLTKRKIELLEILTAFSISICRQHVSMILRAVWSKRNSPTAAEMPDWERV